MYVHLGADVAVPALLIVGLFQLDAALGPASSTLNFLSTIEEAGRLDLLTGDVPRSLVVTLERCYLSPVSTETLRRRWQLASAVPRKDER